MDEGPDGYDTVEWIARQPWSNGKIGTYGLSYAAHTQAALACLNPPHLSCMWLDCGGFSSAFHTGCRNGRAFELRQVTWAFREALESPEVRNDPVKGAAMEAQNIHDWFQRMPWKRGHNPLRWTPDYEDYLLEIWSHETLDDYWRQCGLCAEAFYSEMSDVPQVHLGGWYDTYSLSTTANFAALSGMKRGPVSLIMGPWTHGARSVSHSGNAAFGPDAAVEGNLAADYNHLRLKFFDHWLKGEQNGWDAEPPVRYFAMGGGSGRRNADGRLDHGGGWRSAEQWPPSQSPAVPFFLREGGGLSTSKRPNLRGSSSRYRFDPSHPAPTIGGNLSSGLPIMEPGRVRPAGGAGVLRLPSALPAAGGAAGRAGLPDGTSGGGSGSNRAGRRPAVGFLNGGGHGLHGQAGGRLPAVGGLPGGIRAEPDRRGPAGQVPQFLGTTGAVWSLGRSTAVEIELYPTSNRFARGHRIRLDISSSNFPRLDVNGNTGENPAVSQVRVAAENTIHHDAEHPSQLLLPVVDTSQNALAV